MANVTRYPLDEAFDRFLNGFFVRPVSFEGPAAPAQFRVDVSESEGAYRLRAEIPGVKKEDINISIDGDQIAISAEVKNQRDVKAGERVLRTERYYGKLYRAFGLEQAVDENAVDARYVDGVLELTLPKRAATKAKRIEIR